MAKYGWRNNKLVAKDLEADSSSLTSPVAKRMLKVDKDDTQSNGVAYIRFEAVTAGTTVQYAYLYLGTAGHLMIGTGAPVGTSGAFSDKGTRLGTAS